MPRAADEVVISVDSHVLEPEALWDALPEELQRFRSTLEDLPNETQRHSIEGKVLRMQQLEDLTPDDWDCEYRRDPSGGVDLDYRLADMEREGVDAQVVFPDTNLGLGGGHGSREYHVELAKLYNDWALAHFDAAPGRFRPAALIPVDEVEDAVAESKRCIELGYKTLFLPANVPWRPYWHPDYEPLWSLAAEARIPLSFHVFSGNTWCGTDFAFLPLMTDEQWQVAKRVNEEIGDITERMATTVLGMAAGMGPIVHLTGAGVLERHPELRFAIIEAECGWLAWTLAAMDSMQQKRHLYLSHLPLRASDYFRRQGWVGMSDDPVGIHNLPLTGADCLMWGNDYPHDEGTFPQSRRVLDSMREAMDAESYAKIASGNAAKLYDFDLEALARKRTPAV